ncbi:hypothetical protein QMO56_18480 [Roseomonas sp. E05]|uniref:hypothetical protein n=1 Tax=Roseomonas sp. E05 TaxID=3046310 RepID=UPI0024BAC25E|nr:hypothetical protein [Roseomonas sp. E05]MDJ0390100.1 hypothetical protein [Roseomonas sp. E05]
MTENMTFPAVRQSLDSLLAIYAKAHHYMLCRERAQTLRLRAEEAPGSLAEAIERDFVAFELEDAERALCAAVRAAEPQQKGGEIASRAPRP